MEEAKENNLLQEKKKETSRRRFLKHGLMLSATAAVSFFMPENWFKRKNELDSSSQDTSNEQTEIKEKSEVGRDMLGAIMHAQLKSEERLKLEKVYVDQADTLSKIDAGFWVVNDRYCRRNLLDKRLELRQKGLEGLTPLSKEKVEWCKDIDPKHPIHPEVLAVCESGYEKALVVMDHLQERNVFKDQVEPSDRIASAGAMAMIARFESNNFFMPGEVLSRDQFDPRDKKSEKEFIALQKIAHFMSKQTGMEIDPNLLFSSTTGDIGILQFRPSSGAEVAEDLAKVGVDFNPYDLELGVLAGYIFLAGKKYSNSNIEKAKEALSGWNKDLGEKSEVFDADKSYKSRFNV